MVKLFTINLNKTEGYAEREARWRARRENLVIGVFLIIFGVLSLFTYRNHRAFGEIMQAKERQIQEIERRLEELQRTGKNISKNDVLTLARMEKERFLWASKLKVLAEILPEDVVLTLIDFSNRELELKAISKIYADEKEFDKVSQFMDMLKSTPFFYREFTNIRFSESHRLKVEDQEILALTINCTIEKPVAPVSPRTAQKSGRTSLVDRQSKVKGVPEP